MFLNEYTVLQNITNDMIAVEQAKSTLINFIYPTSLLTALMEDLYIHKKSHLPAHLTSCTDIFCRYKKNL